MKVLMFGWEYPPDISGGLGNACYILTKGLAKIGAETTFVVPYGKNKNTKYAKLIGIEEKKISTIIGAYISSGEYKKKLEEQNIYDGNLYWEVHKYSLAAASIAIKENPDIIHAHDWMTYKAGINAKLTTGKPLIVHIHNTVFDRSSLSPSKYEYDLEKEGFENADKVIAISNKIKETLIEKYNINKNKIETVYWGIDHENKDYYQKQPRKSIREKIVLFVGRITLQKGADYLIEAAKNVLKFEPNTRFIFVGSGDMLPQLIHRTIELGINDKVNFTGWFKPKEVFKAFKLADIFVMPSVSEPFGLVALESMKNGTPAIISKQSGVSEVIHNCLKIDFWDIDEITNKIVNIIRSDGLYNELRYNGNLEINKMNLEKPAEEILNIYKEVLKGG